MNDISELQLLLIESIAWAAASCHWWRYQWTAQTSASLCSY